MDIGRFIDRYSSTVISVVLVEIVRFIDGDSDGDIDGIVERSRRARGGVGEDGRCV
jgi:hypothetical protein